MNGPKKTDDGQSQRGKDKRTAEDAAQDGLEEAKVRRQKSGGSSGQDRYIDSDGKRKTD